MEKTKNLKVKLVASIVSIMACLLIVVVSVFAAATQNVTVSDSITITTAGQARVDVTVSAKHGQADGVLLGDTGADYTKIEAAGYTELAHLAYDNTTGSATGSGLTPVFSLAHQYTYYAYKIDLVNHGTTSADYAIAINNLALGSQLEYVYADDTAIGTSSLLGGTLAATNGTAQVYVVIRLNTALASLVDVATDPFTLTVNISLA
ncbi:MAG: hypothetical protein LBN07_01495 [Christensenellaceae bacterium]|nr:hypothetical protein [Christensenellaceae bacterium]